jgi:tetratricopeptide (TPR) repeat protein
MTRILFLTLFAFVTNETVAKAETTVNSHVVRIIDSAKNFLCNKDTVAAIRQLELIEKTYPNDAHVLFTSKVLGDLCLMKGETDKALKSLHIALRCPPGPYVRSDNNACDNLFNRFSPWRGKADVCISISQVFIKRNNFDSSLHYLKLADDRYIPYRGCVNGIMMYKTNLSLFFADHFIAQGDTVQAINRLIDYLLYVDGDTNAIAKKLKTILRYTYSQQQINDEIEKGLDNLKIVSGKKDQPKNILEFTLFNHTILHNAREKTIELWRYSLAHEESLNLLKN